jgi:hypothetical protein
LSFLVDSKGFLNMGCLVVTGVERMCPLFLVGLHLCPNHLFLLLFCHPSQLLVFLLRNALLHAQLAGGWKAFGLEIGLFKELLWVFEIVAKRMTGSAQVV